MTKNDGSDVFRVIREKFELQQATERAALRAQELANEEKQIELAERKAALDAAMAHSASIAGVVAAPSERERVRLDLLEELGGAERQPMKSIKDAAKRVLGALGYADSENMIRDALREAGVVADGQQTFDRDAVAIALAANLVGRPGRIKTPSRPTETS